MTSFIREGSAKSLLEFTHEKFFLREKYHCIIIPPHFPYYILIIRAFAIVIHCQIPLEKYHQCITISD